MTQQVKRDAHKPDHSSHTCPWCGGQGYKHINTTETAHCTHCKGKGRVSPEKAATYQNSFVAQRRQYIMEQKESKPKKITSEQVRLEIEYGWNPKDNPNHSYWNK